MAESGLIPAAQAAAIQYQMGAKWPVGVTTGIQKGGMTWFGNESCPCGGKTQRIRFGFSCVKSTILPFFST
jgi:hypothetical protein